MPSRSNSLGVHAASLTSLTLVLAGCSAPSQPPSAATPAASTPAAHVHAAHDHSQHVVPAATPLAPQSLYHAGMPFTDQDGRAFELSSLRGSFVLATMFYSSCTSVCPMLIAQLAHLVAELPDEVRAQTHVLLVSLDPERDTPEKLKRLATQHQVADPSWHFVRGDSASVREVAALLGIRYRQLPDGDISHSQVISLLDRHGVLMTRMDNAAGDTAPMIATLTQTAQADSPKGTRHQ